MNDNAINKSSAIKAVRNVGGKVPLPSGHE